jgi:hypothetical protein
MWAAVGWEIREALDGYLAAIAAAGPGARAFVCLSGGLDSSGIAALGREHFTGVLGVSFDLARSTGLSEEGGVRGLAAAWALRCRGGRSALLHGQRDPLHRHEVFDLQAVVRDSIANSGRAH